MKVSREQALENRERIVDVAARAFREHGFDGIGVADLMKQAGLTHGGFYGQFSSKEDLMALACERAIAASVGFWTSKVQASPDDPLGAITKPYLSEAHRDHPGQGCTMAALGADIARQGPALRQVVTDGVQAQIDLLAGLLPGRTAALRQDKAMAAFAGMVGAMVLSRAVNDAGLSAQILHAVADALPRRAPAASRVKTTPAAAREKKKPPATAPRPPR